jgi:hypothetical protein
MWSAVAKTSSVRAASSVRREAHIRGLWLGQTSEADIGEEGTFGQIDPQHHRTLVRALASVPTQRAADCGSNTHDAQWPAVGLSLL